MKTIKLSDIDLLRVGHEIQLYGAIYSDRERIYLIPLPDENPKQLNALHSDILVEDDDMTAVELVMDADEMAKFLNQADVLDVLGPGKAILRKSQRQVDSVISWRVYRRDGYACRYCGRDDAPLTVDHIDLWEDGGATVDANLNTCCRRCNKLRGRTAYPDWIASRDYAKVSKKLDPLYREANLILVPRLGELVAMRTGKTRSR